MMSSVRARQAFTLVELLVALAIVAALAAILFPVFRSAKAATQRTVCASNFKQVIFTTQMYQGDYDDTYPLVNYDVANLNNPAKDRTWVQLLMPYLRSFGTFQCPSDYSDKPKPDALFDGDLVVGDAYRRYYRASLRSNLGYNYLQFSPVYWANGRWVVQPRNGSAISDSARALLYVDTVYSRSSDGRPVGGGSYIVIPPCRYARVGTAIADTFAIPQNAPVYAPNQGWLVNQPNSVFQYGLAWPWHESRMNIALVAGGTIPVHSKVLADGCDVRNNWAGLINDTGKYAWDSN